AYKCGGLPAARHARWPHSDVAFTLCTAWRSGFTTVTAPGTDVGVGSRAEIQAVDRISQILGLFTDERVRLTTGSVAHALGLSRTTAHRSLNSRAAEALLEPCANPAGYRLGSRILRIGGLTIGQGHAVTVAAEAMATLAAEVGTTISLSL